MDHFFYRTISGRPRPRRWLIAALGLLVVLVAAAVWQHGLQRPPAGGAARPPGVLKAARLPAPTAAPPPTPDPTPTAFTCPEEPEAWSYQAVFPGDHYRRIEPVCVYEGLSRSAAWMLLSRMGYPLPDAAERLGFADLPWSPALSFTGYTNMQGPLVIALQPGWPPHPDFRFWQVDTEGQPGAVLGLRGCYPFNETVFCVLALDRAPGSAISVLGETHFASHAAQAPWTRSFWVLRYAGAGVWEVLGQMEDVSIELESGDASREELETVSARLGVQVWDAAWLAEEFGLQMSPVPRDWRLYGMDEQAIRTIGEGLNEFMPDLTGGPGE